MSPRRFFFCEAGHVAGGSRAAQQSCMKTCLLKVGKCMPGNSWSCADNDMHQCWETALSLSLASLSLARSIAVADFKIFLDLKDTRPAIFYLDLPTLT